MVTTTIFNAEKLRIGVKVSSQHFCELIQSCDNRMGGGCPTDVTHGRLLAVTYYNAVTVTKGSYTLCIQHGTAPRVPASTLDPAPYEAARHRAVPDPV